MDAYAPGVGIDREDGGGGLGVAEDEAEFESGQGCVDLAGGGAGRVVLHPVMTNAVGAELAQRPRITPMRRFRVLSADSA